MNITRKFKMKSHEKALIDLNFVIERSYQDFKTKYNDLSIEEADKSKRIKKELESVADALESGSLRDCSRILLYLSKEAGEMVPESVWQCSKGA